jgi:prepilin peptidase CpaA
LVLSVATFTDLRCRRIPNWLVLPFLIIGFTVSIVHAGWAGLQSSILGILLGIGVPGVFYWLGGMGMGDVKLFAALGAWVGPRQLTTALVLTGLIGGVMAIFWALFSGYLKAALLGVWDLVFGLRQRCFKRETRLELSCPQAHKMPYAPAIALGTILSFLAGGM